MTKYWRSAYCETCDKLGFDKCHCAPLTCLCPAPAAPGSDYCELCAEALLAPDPLCSECGEPLAVEDVEAGEATCLECAGEALEQGLLQ